jgi:hypothetical protein
MTDLCTADGRELIPEPDSVQWRKSSRSTFNGNCVEVGIMSNGNGVLVRDTKNPGPTLEFASDIWSAFIIRTKKESI